jgi:prepilin-type N-terminal cleavage/methylation domain-containing protein
LFRNKPGFTLIEVLTAVILLAVMAAVVIPRYRVDYTTKRRIKNAILQIASNIRYARRLAVTDIDASNYIIRFDFDDQTYGIYRVTMQWGWWNWQGQEDLIGELKPIPSEITPSGQSSFQFSQLGNADYSGSGVLTLTGPSHIYTISVIKATGEIAITEQ